MNIKIIPHIISEELKQELVAYDGDDFHRKIELENVANIQELQQFLSTISHFYDLQTTFLPTKKIFVFSILDAVLGSLLFF